MIFIKVPPRYDKLENKTPNNEKQSARTATVSITGSPNNFSRITIVPTTAHVIGVIIKTVIPQKDSPLRSGLIINNLLLL